MESSTSDIRRAAAGAAKGSHHGVRVRCETLPRNPKIQDVQKSIHNIIIPRIHTSRSTEGVSSPLAFTNAIWLLAFARLAAMLALRAARRSSFSRSSFACESVRGGRHHAGGAMASAISR